MQAIAVMLGTSLLAQSQALPFELVGDKVVLTVDARTSRGTYVPLRLLLDTGASICVLDAQLGSELFTGADRIVAALGAANRGRFMKARTLKALRLGSVEQALVFAAQDDLTSVNRWFDNPVQGLLGMNFLGGKVFTVDPVRRQFTWNTWYSPSRTIQVKTHAKLPCPVTSIQAGAQAFEVLLDTGAYGLSLPQVPRGAQAVSDCHLVRGLDGAQKASRVQVDVEAFGERFPAQHLLVCGGRGLMGAWFLLAGTTSFDFSRGIIGLPLDGAGRLVRRQPGSQDWGDFPVCWNRKGKQAFLEVAELQACSPWYQAGFRLGDRVEAVASRTGSQLSRAAIYELIQNGAELPWQLSREGKPLTVKNPSLTAAAAKGPPEPA